MSRQCLSELEKIAAGGEEGGSHGCGRVSLELCSTAPRRGGGQQLCIERRMKVRRTKVEVFYRRTTQTKKNIQNDTLLNHALSVNVQTYNGDNRKRKGSGHVHSGVIGQVTEVGLGD